MAEFRYRDAAHVDLGGFRTRLPFIGRFYWFMGLALCAATAIWADDTRYLYAVLIVSVVGWLRAWSKAVGAAWRTPLVCAALISALSVSLPTLKPLVKGWL